MKNRSTYEKLSIYGFLGELASNLSSFSSNMKKLNVKEMSFPEWFETFGAWLEVGTESEEMFYGREV